MSRNLCQNAQRLSWGDTRVGTAALGCLVE
jgi:hypothetical protein